MTGVNILVDLARASQISVLFISSAAVYIMQSREVGLEFFLLGAAFLSIASMVGAIWAADYRSNYGVNPP